MKNKGITLIALIITIIVMLILVGITVTITLNKNLFVVTEESAFKTALSQLKEQIYGPMNIGQYTGERQNYESYVPEELKAYIGVNSRGILMYIGDTNIPQARWAEELGVFPIDETGYIAVKSVEQILDLARSYVAENHITTDPNLLALQYIRRNRYNSSVWRGSAGKIDQNFVNYVEAHKTDTLDLTDLTDPVTGANIDYIHGMASLNVYLYRKDDSRYDIYNQFACWAGDLCQLVKQVHDYNTQGTYTREELEEYTKTLLGSTSGNSTLSLDDLIADIDAVNISQLVTEDDDLDDVIYEYYYGKYSNISENRYAYFVDYLGKFKEDDPSRSLKNVTMNFLGKGSAEITSETSSYAYTLIGSDYRNISLYVFNAVANSFAEFIEERI